VCCTASTPTFDVVTVMCSEAVWPCVSVAVAVHVPTASPVIVSAAVGPLPVVGLMVATLAQAVAAMLKVPV
jgi:ABC-type enterochelin transport system permease subunit